MKNSCTNETIGSFTVANGADAEDPCVPTFTTAHNAATHKTTAQYTCGSTSQSFEIPDGVGVCDDVANAATAVKTYTKTYTAPTATAAGYVALQQTMCDGGTNTTNYQDTCTPIISSNKDICSGNGGTYMECTRQDTGAAYNICKAITTENASAISTAISTAQTAAENAATAASAAQSTADNAQSTANTTANKVDNENTGLVATYSLASQANTGLANKLSKNVTFAEETVDGVLSYVLKEGNTTVAVLAAKEDLKGDPGDTPCSDIQVVKNTSASTEEAAQYDVICVE